MSRTQKFFAGLIYLAIPATYAISPYISIVLIILQGFILCAGQEMDGNRFALFFINAALFSSFSFVSLRLYDWVIFFTFLSTMWRKKLDLQIPARVVFILTILIFNTVVHEIDSSTLLQFVRYLFSLLAFVLAFNLDFDFKRIYDQLKLISFSAIYNAVCVYLLISIGKISSLTGSIVSSNIFIYNQQLEDGATSVETRLNGFFSDPNKYMVFCFALLIIYELFLRDRQRRILEGLVMIAAVLSLSRTALLVIIIFLLFKQMYFLKQRSLRGFVLELVVLSALFVVMATVPDLLATLENNIYDAAAQLLGRTNTLKINSSISSDNRVIVWKQAIVFIKQEIIIGHGWLSYSNLLPYPTHNTILQLMLDGGIIVTFSWLYFFWPMFTDKKSYVLLACFLIPSMFLELGDFRLWYFLLGLILNRQLRSNLNAKTSDSK